MLHNRHLLLQNMENEGLDVIISCKAENTIYFTDFHSVGSRTIKNRYTYVLYFREFKFEPMVLIPFMDRRHFCDITWIPEENVLPFSEFATGNESGLVVDKYGEIFRQVCERGLEKGTIGIEMDFLPSHVVEKFRSVFPNANIVDASPAIYKTRMIKTPEEIDKLRKACLITEKGCLKIMEMAARERTELEAACAGRAVCMEEGGETIGFTALGAGDRSSMVHNNPRNEKILNGQVVHFDFGSLYDGYWGDLARSYIFNRSPRPDQQKVYDAVLAAQNASLEAVKPGVTAGDVYDAGMKAGLSVDPAFRREHIGHGVGLEIHEGPFIIKGNNTVIEPGMVICIEAAKHVPEIGGFQVEDNYFLQGHNAK